MKILICSKKLLSKIELKALENIKTIPIFTEFENNWEEKVLNNLLEIVASYDR